MRSADSTLAVMDSMASSMSTTWLFLRPLAGSLATPMMFNLSVSLFKVAIKVVTLVVPMSMAEMIWDFGIVSF